MRVSTSLLRKLAIAAIPCLLLGAAPAEKPLRIFFIDVMGGAATLIVTPESESVLIDSGWPGLEDRDPKRIVSVLKEVAGLDHLDHLVTTHWHTDHYGGVAGLAKRVSIGHYWDRGLPDLDAPGQDREAYPDGPRRDDPLGKAYREASNGKRTTLKAGDRIPLKGGVELVVLASGGKVIDKPASSDTEPNRACATSPPDRPVDPSDNARSLALRLRFKNFGFLDCGDLTWNVEKQLVCPVDRIGPIDLYQVTHHGMGISNHPTLLKTIEPTVAIMNNGPKKGGDPVSVKRLKDLPSLKAAYQLHKNVATGDYDNTDPGRIANKSPEGGQFIQVEVAPSAESFSVRIGTDGAAAKFETR
ncbi:MAG: MBL fold metallo-hydrolase [Isosphaeraceae bacterium]